VIPIAVACDTSGDSSSRTTTVERTVTEAPTELATGAEQPTTTGAEQPTTTAAAPATTDSATTPEGVGPGFVWFAQADDGALRPVASLAADPAEVAEAVAAGTDEPDLVGGLPPGTAVQFVTVDGSTATVDLSDDFVIGYQTGSAAETVAVAPLVYSLTELPNVDSVLITVGGAAPTPVGASFDFSNPLTRADVPAGFAEGFG
jgi:spore germination protein GerM